MCWNSPSTTRDYTVWLDGRSIDASQVEATYHVITQLSDNLQKTICRKNGDFEILAYSKKSLGTIAPANSQFHCIGFLTNSNIIDKTWGVAITKLELKLKP